MKVEKNKVAYFHYTLTAVDGDFSETSAKSEPVAFLVGHGNIMPALEAALSGAEAGDEVEVTLEPRDAYGERRPNAIQRVPIKHLMSSKNKLAPGNVVKINTAEGVRDATVVKVGRFNVDVDTNHPLAGKTLKFQLRITEVRDASAEEIAHGHAHGAGGHHH
ncbi:MAG: peptidylprolyl isomerase [Porticoccaceae bacterium]|nr:peptidylprolyl isomerase [Porticoccaceae bacterium]